MERSHPELRDPDYGCRLSRLQRLLVENPGRPLALLLGSSRSQMGFRPDSLPSCQTQDGRTPIAFNFGIQGAGPVVQLLCLYRLLAAGIRPDLLIVEVLPPLLHQEWVYREETWFELSRLELRDLPVARRYFVNKWLYGRWVQREFLSAFTHRFSILCRYAPKWLPAEYMSGMRDNFGWDSADCWGWRAMRTPRTPETYRAAMLHAHGEYYWALHPFRVTETPDRALRELLEICRHERIPTMLLLMPEGTDFRRYFYPPEAQVAINEYLNSVSKQYETPLIDARTWIQDEEFIDSHHLIPHGATQFTERLGREVLQPYFESNAQALTGQARNGAAIGERRKGEDFRQVYRLPFISHQR
jgi:hypothetical protein